MLSASGLIANETLEKAMAEWRADNAARPETPLPQYLLEIGLISEWQRRHLSAGRSTGFALGEYTIVEKLGVGPSAAVYLAERAGTRSRVALKVVSRIYAGAPGHAEWLDGQARSLATGDPGLTRIYDVGTDPGRWYIARELVIGHTLYELINRAKMISIDDVGRLMAQIADSVAAVHRGGGCLCNVTPMDVMLDENGNVKIPVPGLSWASFGRALVSRCIYDRATYTSLGHACDNGIVEASDWRDDVFSIGCLLYYLLTASRPPSDLETGGAVRAIRRLRPDAPTAFVELVASSIAIGRDALAPTAADMAQCFENWNVAS